MLALMKAIELVNCSLARMGHTVEPLPH